MNTNITRHAYVKYNARPYNWDNGIPLDRSTMYTPQCVSVNNIDDRTIIRTNENHSSCSSKHTFCIKPSQHTMCPLANLSGFDDTYVHYQKWQC